VLILLAFLIKSTNNNDVLEIKDTSNKTIDSLIRENKVLSDYIQILEEENQMMGSLLAEKENKKKVSKSRFKSVPGGNNIYRSNQPNLKQLKEFLLTHDVQTVIRMNNEEGTGVSIESDLIYPILENGKVLVHCTAGKDRTGYIIGYYLLNTLKWTKNEVWDYTIQHNDWEKFISEGRGGYIKYMEAFYPYEEWIKNYK
jgi:protein tyrosine/serine phosphatase